MKNNYLELRNKKKIIRLVSTHLKKIYEAAKSIAKDWDKNTIPLTTLKVIIEKSKLKTTGIAANDIFINQFNGTLDQLYIDLENIAEKMDSKSIPLPKIKEGLDVINKSFSSALIKS